MSVKSISIRKEASVLNEKVVNLLKVENRSAANNTEIDGLLAECDSKLSEARRMEASEKVSAENRSTDKHDEDQIKDPNAPKPKPSKGYESKEVREERAYNERHAFVDCVMSRDNPEALAIVKRAHLGKGVEFRDELAISTPLTAFTANGSYLVPQGFQAELDVAMKAFGNMVGDARVIQTDTGNPVYWPTENDTGNYATVIGEAQPVQEEDIQAFGHVLLGAWKYTSGLIRVSTELSDDSFTSIETIIRDAMAIRWGRGLNMDLTNGNGVNKCLGIIPAITASNAVPVTAVGSSANDGIVGNTGTNSVGYADFVNLIHSVDPAYRVGPKVRFMFPDKVLQATRLLLDKYGRPLWVPGTTQGAPDTIVGYPYSINQQMLIGGGTSPYVPGLAHGNVSVVFGDFSKFIVRKVRDQAIQKLVERFAEYGETAFVSFARVDSRLVDASGQALNYLVQA
jgi:HK97 family phage major capsid protein